MKAEHVPPVAKSGPTTAYVTRLLVSLLHTESGELILREPDPLPALPHVDPGSAGGFPRVANRLKVLTLLTPMRYPEPVSGSMTFFVGDREATASLEFHDSDSPRWLRIHCRYTGHLDEQRR